MINILLLADSIFMPLQVCELDSYFANMLPVIKHNYNKDLDTLKGLMAFY